LTSRISPFLVLVALVSGAFLAATLAPYRVDVDTGFQLRSLQQWVRGESPNPATVRLPDPNDLSRDRLVWCTWWPPGFPFLLAPLAAAGASLAMTLRVMCFLFFLTGGIGWLRLADRFFLSPPMRMARLLYAVSIAAYAVTVGGAATLPWADVLGFAAAPWLMALALRGEEEASPFWLLAAGLALGCSYWLKYTLFLMAIPLAGWLGLRLLLRAGDPWTWRASRLAALTLGFALPVAALFALNFEHSDGLTSSLSGNRSSWVKDGPQDVGLVPLSLGAAAAPGLALFQNHLWITHLVYFSDARLPFLKRLDTTGRLRLKSLLGLPATAALFWGLALGLKAPERSALPSLALTVTGGFYLILAVVSLLVGYIYLANEPRFGVVILPLLQAPALAGWLSAVTAGRLRRVAVVLVVALFFTTPLLFAATEFAKHQLLLRLAAPYTAGPNGLYIPEISPRSVPEVQAAINATLRSPHDLVVLAGPLGWGSPLMMWLDFPWRTLPETTFFDPLSAGYRDTANLRSMTPLRSSGPLRVVLVGSKSLLPGGELDRLRARFPQAHAWQAAPVPAHSNLVLWFSDLEAVP